MARPSVRILSRYLLRQHVAPLGFALGSLTAFLMVQQICEKLGSRVGNGMPWSVFIEVFVLSIPFIVAMARSVAALVAVVHTFTRRVADNEITAMKAGGVSLGRVVAPVLGGAALVTLVALVWNDQVLPRANHRLRTLQMDITRKKPSFALKEQVINEVTQGQFFLRAARIDPATNRLKDVTIYDLGDAPERRRIIVADSGQMAYTPGGKDLYLTLRDGEIQEVKRTEPGQFNRTFFRTNRIKVANIGDTLTRTQNDTYRTDREMSLCDLARQVRIARREEARVHVEARAAVAADLRRLAGPCFAFALLGIAVALTLPRGGAGVVIGTSVAVFAIYYIGLIGGEDLGDRLIVSPFVAMWIPNLLFVVVGLVGLWLVRREGGGARGGDVADLRDTLLGWLGRKGRRA